MLKGLVDCLLSLSPSLSLCIDLATFMCSPLFVYVENCSRAS
jgi:hypothetical protein